MWIALTGGITLGWYLAALAAVGGVENWSFYVMLVFMAMFSLGLSQIISRYTALWVARRRARSREKRILKDPASRR